MSTYVLSDGSVAHVTHTMADGSVLESLDEYVPDFEKMSPELLHLLDKWVCTDMEEEMKKGL